MPTFDENNTHVLREIRDELSGIREDTAAFIAENELTLRDRFAIAALPALASKMSCYPKEDTINSLVEVAYRYADAALLLRKRKKNDR